MNSTPPSSTASDRASHGERVSIIMPTHNRAHLIGESIASALGQVPPPHEVVVVDDGSTDQTAEIVKNFGGPVRYVKQEKAGKSAALNRAIAVSQGDLLLVLDDDDLLPPGALAAHVAAFRAAPQAGFAYGRFARFTGQGEDAPLSTDLEPLPDPGERRLLVQLMRCCFLPNPAWMVRREVQLAVGPYRTDLPRGQDFEMILRIARRSAGAFAGAVTLYQRKHVAARMTAQGKVVATDTVSGWIDAERKIFREIDARWDDTDFRPFDAMPGGLEGERLAVLQRAVILFMKKAHPEAERQFARYAALLGDAAPSDRELVVAGDLLGARYGIGEICDASHDPAPLAALGLPLALRRAMARQMPWRMRELIGAGRLGDAARLIAWGRRALGSAALLGATGARIETYLRRARPGSAISPA